MWEINHILLLETVTTRDVRPLVRFGKFADIALLYFGKTMLFIKTKVNRKIIKNIEKTIKTG